MGLLSSAPPLIYIAPAALYLRWSQPDLIQSRRAVSWVSRYTFRARRSLSSKHFVLSIITKTRQERSPLRTASGLTLLSST